MINTFFYFISLVSLFIFALVKKYNIVSIMLILLYTVVGFLAVFVHSNQLVDSSGVTLFPYVVLLIIYLLFFGPLLKKEKILGSNKVSFKPSIVYLIFCLLFIVCGLVTIALYLPVVLNLLVGGNWALNRLDLYMGTIQNVYSNRLEFIAINFVSYFRTPAIIIGFLFLGKYNLKHNKEQSYLKTIGYLTILTAIISSVLMALRSSSRGSIVSLLFLLLIIYLFLRKEINKKRRRFIRMSFFAILLLLSPVLLNITISRFSSDEALDSIIRYLGHAPIVFNEHIFTLPDFAFGNYSLGALFKTTFTEASVGGNWDTLFFTFVGWFWIDWSFIGTIIISIIVFSTMNFIIRKKRYDLSDLFLIVTYFQFLTSGVFVIGRQYIYTLISNLIIYALLKLICSFDFAKQPNFVYSNNTDLL